jgi:site-specific DNA-methyltransferase (adenine-specific)
MTTTLPSPKDSRQPEGAAGLAAPLGSASWGGVSVLNSDCMEVMREYPDAHFDLAICDPPWGIGADKNQNKLGGKRGHTPRAGTYKKYHDTDWDNSPPDSDYFRELLRVSKNQIVWGGNYYHDLHLSGVIIWCKLGSGNYKEGEMAKTSFDVFKVFRYSRADAYINDCDDKIHPTQKPVKLYSWLLHNHAKKGQRILDTHLGSGSSAIACSQFGVEMVGCEIDETYFATAVERIGRELQQGMLV